jgi:hypothetical protein
MSEAGGNPQLPGQGGYHLAVSQQSSEGQQRIALRNESTGIWIVGAVLAAYALLWLAVWLPLYVFRYSGMLFLFPIWLFIWFALALAMTAGLILSIIGLSGTTDGGARRRLSRSIVVASIFLVLSLPVLWWGSAPLLLFGITDLSQL